MIIHKMQHLQNLLRTEHLCVKYIAMSKRYLDAFWASSRNTWITLATRYR